MNSIDRKRILIHHIIKSGVVSSQKELGRRMGYNNESYFSQIINEKVDTPKDFISKLKLIYPNFSSLWLSTGEGSMTNNDKCGPCESPSDIIEVDGIPILSEEVATKPEQDIRKYIEECSSELEQVNPNELLKRADLAEKILHTSMLPTFQPEDIVFIRFIPSQMEIVDGNTYYIDSKKYPTLIRRIKVLDDGNLRLIAQNKQFADITIHSDDINNIGAIVGMLRMNFGNQYDEIEALRTQKDEALAHRDAQMDKIIENQSKLIDFITKTK